MATQKLAKKYVKETTGIAGAHDDLDLFAKDSTTLQFEQPFRMLITLGRISEGQKTCQTSA
jgi:hypothetical protein